MIRVVPICYYLDDDPGDESHLAFLDTVTDTFIEFDGEQIWESWDELSIVADKGFLGRMYDLVPEWFLGLKG